IVIPPAIFFYYSTLSDSRFKTLQQNRVISMNPFLFLQIGVDTRIMRVLNYYCKRNNKRK
ncbi:TPA: hypothetical protein ACKE26_002880, partial [Enterococcus faecium]